MSKGCIYIMTNPCLKGMVKIGYATDVEARRKQLSTTALPYAYEIYATYETPGKLEDKKLHRLIDALNPDLRVSANKEFFVMTPEEAFELLDAISIISGTVDKLKRYKKESENDDSDGDKQVVKRPRIDFSECGIPVGAELVCVLNSQIRPVVVDNHKVSYNGEICSLTAIIKSITDKKHGVAGPSYFTYKGEALNEIAARTQWRNY